MTTGPDTHDPIQLEPYNSDWPQQAQHEIELIGQALPADQVVNIQHIGSTAIVGMTAKPIIDIQVAVDSLDTIRDDAIAALEAMDYVFWADNPNPDRMFFVKGMPPYGKQRTHHVHIHQADSHHCQDRIFFRDYLNKHPDDAKTYMELKQELATQYHDDREAYTKAKADFINQVLRKIT